MNNENYTALYNNADKTIMKLAEDSLDRKLDRIDEIIAFAREAKYDKIGIANCIALEKQSAALENILKKEGFSVVRVNCKLGKVQLDSILPGYSGITCNPAGQASVLNKNNAQINIILGLCIGHDLVFNSKANAPSTTLAVKDRKLKHNTLSRLNAEQQNETT